RLGRLLDLALGLLDAALEHAHGALAVLELGPLLRRLRPHTDLLAVREPARPDVARAGVDLVHVLPALAARAEGLELDLGRVQVDLDRVVDLGVNEDARERRVPPAGGVEGRDADEAVDAVLGLEVAVGE